MGMALDCGNTNRQFSMSGGMVKSTTAAVTGAFAPFLNKQVHTGSLINMISTGSLIQWNPADLIKVQTVSTRGTPENCSVRVTSFDKQGS